MTHDAILILDFGSQYSQLIARRVREHHVYCRLEPCNVPFGTIRALKPKGIILSGGPSSVWAPGAPTCDRAVLDLGVPVLGICYGMQLLAQMAGGRVEGGHAGEYGPATIEILEGTGKMPVPPQTPQIGGTGVPPVLPQPVGFFAGCEATEKVWMSHGDRVVELPAGAAVTARTPTVEVAAFADPARRIYAVQFHPEVSHTPQGSRMLHNFLFDICGCRGDWTMASFIAEAVADIKQRVGADRVVCGLSGGVDSTVVATLIHRAIGDQLTCIFVDNGVLRAGEAEEVVRMARDLIGLKVDAVAASERFLRRLAGLTDPEEKRLAIGDEFVRVFTEEAERIGGARFLAQGTLFPDLIESKSAFGGPSARIKSHHNVGGMPAWSQFELIEPLRELFKDEVRELGGELGLPPGTLHRQPFPGPGLAVRVVGEVTRSGLHILREADAIVQEEMRGWEGYGTIWQSFAVLLPVKSVGVMGDARTYDFAVAVRVVSSRDGMTADWVRLPYDLMARLSARIINEVDGVNRVLYDISSKPPSTIEWE
ncbi:MAG TPA: glutamine-hydrolyzing GMP synthase [Planctomycetota bacterium]|nr:glutamine-hydrolyzing GMP synthase [Planctomycetota bacterium]